MQQSNPISTWLVLGPIYNNNHQGASHSRGDGHPLAADIIMDIDNNPVRPRQLTRLLDRAPQEGDKATYGNGIIYNNQTYAWRALNFANMNWQNIKEIEDNIHLHIATGPDANDPFSPLSFIGKHHALAFFLVYIESPDSRTTRLCVRGDDSIRVWLNGKEIEELYYAGERDITQWSNETYVPVTLSKGHNILMAAVAETHVEWGFSARFENDRDLRITTSKPADVANTNNYASTKSLGRVVYKATYVPIEAKEDQNVQRGIPTRAFEKTNFIASLAVDPSELPRLHELASESTKDGKKQSKDISSGSEIIKALETIEVFVNDRSPSASLKAAPRIAKIDRNLLGHLGNLLAQTRQEKENFDQTARLVEEFEQRKPIEPVGRLHLERLEMNPDGIERGELIYTVPLAPKETVNIIHKEWSTKSQEFEKIVQDVFEGYSEQGVAEKHELAQAVETQSRHSTGLNISSAISGGIPSIVTLGSSVGYNASSDESKSVKDSQNHSISLTRKASARTKKDYKVTFKVASVAGSEDQSVRVITNPSDTKAIRIDYFQLIRRWKVNLYRYGLRLTYDIAIPAPGAALRTKVQEIFDLNKSINMPFGVDLKKWGDFKILSEEKVTEEAGNYGVNLDPPPQSDKKFVLKEPTPPIGPIKREDANALKRQYSYELNPDYEAVSVQLIAEWVIWDRLDDKDIWAFFNVEEGDQLKWAEQSGAPRRFDDALNLDRIQKEGGKLIITVHTQHISTFAITLVVTAKPIAGALDNWKYKAWLKMREAAEQSYYQNLQFNKEKRERLIEDLSKFDALTLRRMEREEVMRGVLRWLFGPGFDEIPEDISAAIKELQDAKKDPNIMADIERWQKVMEFGQNIKFIHHAVEWENILYFTYPYFWDSKASWEMLRDLDHPDPTHRMFLRAGSARVVIPIRPGFEEDFFNYVETGVIAEIPHHPYITIAEEIKNFARTNYQNISAAYREKDARPLLFSQQRKAWNAMQKLMHLLEFYKENSPDKNYPTTERGLEVLRTLHFPVKVSSDNTINELPLLFDPWGNDYIYTSPGQSGDYDLVCYGANGKPGGTDLDADISSAADASLIATWYEYTPTSAMDISINTEPSELK